MCTNTDGVKTRRPRGVSENTDRYKDSYMRHKQRRYYTGNWKHKENLLNAQPSHQQTIKRGVNYFSS